MELTMETLHIAKMGGIVIGIVSIVVVAVTWILVRIPGKKEIVKALEAEGDTRALWQRRKDLDRNECTRLSKAVRECRAGTLAAREKVCRSLWHNYAKRNATDAEGWREVARCSEAVGNETGEAGQWIVAVDAWKKAWRHAASKSEREADDERWRQAKAEMKRLERLNRSEYGGAID